MSYKNNIQHKYLEKFMREALKMAHKAYQNNEVPVGSVITMNKKIIGYGCNSVIRKNSVASHAEINAINQASSYLNNYRLSNCQIYVTLEPCHMCAKAIVDARIENLYFGAFEPKTGAISSIDKFLDRKDINHRTQYSGGHMQDQSSDLLKKFFKLKRL